MVVQNVAFWLIAIPTVLAAIAVVTTRNVVHAALYLVGVLGGVAATYLLMVAEFVAWVQVLIYIGAVVVLLLFGVMLTRAPMHPTESLTNANKLPAIVFAVGVFMVVVSAVLKAFDGVQIDIGDSSKAVQIRDAGLAQTIGDSVLRTYLIPFEVIGMLLLAAVIGAVALARRD